MAVVVMASAAEEGGEEEEEEVEEEVEERRPVEEDGREGQRAGPDWRRAADAVAALAGRCSSS